MTSNAQRRENVSSDVKDIDEYDFNESQVFSRDDVTDENLGQSLKALQGLGRAEEVKTEDEEKSDVTVKEAIPSDVGSHDSARTEVYSRECITNINSIADVRDTIDGMMDTIEAFSDRSKVLQRAQKQQDKEIKNLHTLVDAKNATVSAMQKIIDKQQVRIKELEEDLASIDTMVLDKLDKFNEGVKSRIQENNEAIKRTPDLIERILESTNSALAFLPEDLKKTVKEVRLTEPEQHVLATIRSNVKTTKKKLPKHLR
nr:ORF1 protein [Fusarium graminearum sclerotimonavirus 1]